MDAVQAELKAWEEEHHAKRKQSSVTAKTKLSGNQLREKGNELFRAGDFEGAEKFYCESLDEEETVEALANRALVRLKLNRPLEAILDCEKALKRDPDNVKCLARRGTANSVLGDHQAALEDFTRAETLEPGNKILRREREREEAFIQALLASKKNNTKVLKAKEERSLTHGATVVEVEEIVASSSSDSSDIPEKKNRTTSSKSSPLVVAENEEVMKNALRSIENTISLPNAPPQTAFMFNKIWRDLSGRCDLQRDLLTKVLHEEDYARIFSASMDPTLLSELLLVLEGENLIRILSYLAKLKPFPLAKMMLDSKKQEAIKNRATPSFSRRAQELLM